MLDIKRTIFFGGGGVTFLVIKYFSAYLEVSHGMNLSGGCGCDAFAIGTLLPTHPHLSIRGNK